MLIVIFDVKGSLVWQSVLARDLTINTLSLPVIILCTHTLNFSHTFTHTNIYIRTPHMCRADECSAGKYKASSGVNTACDACGAGKYQARAGSAMCDECEAGKYKADTGATACNICEAGKYSAALGVYLLAICKHTPARTRAHKHARADTICTCMYVWMKFTHAHAHIGK